MKQYVSGAFSFRRVLHNAVTSFYNINHGTAKLRFILLTTAAEIQHFDHKELKISRSGHANCDLK